MQGTSARDLARHRPFGTRCTNELEVPLRAHVTGTTKRKRRIGARRRRQLRVELELPVVKARYVEQLLDQVFEALTAVRLPRGVCESAEEPACSVSRCVPRDGRERVLRRSCETTSRGLGAGRGGFWAARGASCSRAVVDAEHA